MDTKFNDILKAFKMKYPKRNATQIFELSDGYLIEAPDVKTGIDYNDPYFYVSNDLKTVRPYRMDRLKEFSIAIGRGAIWTR